MFGYATMMGMLRSGGVLVIVLVAALTVAGVVVVRRSGSSSSAGSSNQAIEVLRHRYAAGEIDDEEFERRLAALQRH